MSTNALVTIGHGAPNPLLLAGALEPSGYSAATSTITDSGTSVSGKLLGAVVRHDVVQISLAWNYLSADDWARIIGRFQANYFVTVRFFDQTRNAWDVRDMYISDRNAGMYRHRGNQVGWTGCSLQLTEV